MKIDRLLLAMLLCAPACSEGPEEDAAEAETDNEPPGGTMSEAETDESSDTGVEDCADLEACGDACVDVMSDPFNCGACDVTCSAVDGAPSCVAGACAVGTCEPGFADCDGDPGNGCELEVACENGGGCETSCGSQGALACGDVCAPECIAPAEECNAADDDCNGACDEGELANCRQGLNRYYSDAMGWMITADPELVAETPSFQLEDENYLYLYMAMAEGLVPLFHCAGRGNHYRTEPTCLDGSDPYAQIGFVSLEERCEGQPLYQVSNPDAMPAEFFYTTDEGERDEQSMMPGWVDDGVIAWVWAGP